jgi:hypothetical protein
MAASFSRPARTLSPVRGTLRIDGMSNCERTNRPGTGLVYTCIEPCQAPKRARGNKGSWVTWGGSGSLWEGEAPAEPDGRDGVHQPKGSAGASPSRLEYAIGQSLRNQRVGSILARSNALPTEPKCPTCGARGDDLRMVCQYEARASFLTEAARAETIHSYICKCGACFTHHVPHLFAKSMTGTMRGPSVSA